MANEILNEVNMDKKLEELGKSFTEKERFEINGAAMKPFEKHLRNFLQTNLKNNPYGAKQISNGEQHLLDTLKRNKVSGGEVELGFTKKGKKAYIGRFLNDGWDVKNQYGGPYRHVEGMHFWEETESATEHEVKKAELEAIKKVMKRRGL
ncbi:hypothetical protein FP435_04520 [Lactobacillus sp. PV037]|uniref:hypothetical protein n=1 Tax=Lactobacillus sp. PV037 TaxID=2594496 RepID=UPI002240E10C|nr:hypothetical protein [Lactobacillus sp. PV037]QNQ83758.1 hypothetical protein FP435_04520 [Lactobacillus sp. PV037]